MNLIYPFSANVKFTVRFKLISLLMIALILMISGCGGSSSSSSSTTTYAVTYESNDATSGNVPGDSAEYEEGQTVTIPGNSGNLQRTDHTFAGWCMNTDGTGATYNESDTLTLGTSDITLYAKWTNNAIDPDPDNESPTTPVSLTTGAVSASSISLSWNASTDNIGVTGYKIYRDGVEISTTSNLYYSDAGLIEDTSYSYSVSAYDSAGNESSQSIAVSEDTLDSEVNSGAELGMNLAEVKDWSTAWVFVDRMKNARQWVAVDQGGHSASNETVLLGPQGYPLEIPYDPDGNGPIEPQQVKTYLYIGDHFPAGTHTLIFEGTGQISLAGGASGSFTEPGVAHHFDFSSNAILELYIRESLSSDPIRNIRVIMPGFEDDYDTQIFHPLFLERLQGFKTLRFLFWGQVWGSTVETWDQVTPADYYTQATEEGVAPEYMIELSNRLNSDPYICVPYLADENYVRTLARLIRDNLNPGLKVYIEWGNEVWNGSHPEAQYVREQGTALGFAPGNEYLAGELYYVRRSAELFQMFEEEFGGSSRLVKVIAGFSANSWTAEQLLAGLENNLINPTSQRADALAIAPYFGGTLANAIVANGEVDSITVDEILDRMEVCVQTDTAVSTAKNSAIAQKYNVPLITYEGGPHLVATGENMKNEILTGKLIEANRDPRMEEIYSQMLSAWYDNGGGLFTAFLNVEVLSKYGSWGMFEYQDQPVEDAPKYRAMQPYLQ